jgi:hypothetical protein
MDICEYSVYIRLVDPYPDKRDMAHLDSREKGRMIDTAGDRNRASSPPLPSQTSEETGLPATA